MLIKTKAKSALKMLITLFLTLALTMGIYFAIPKQSTKVSAATAGSSAVLSNSWESSLASPVTKTNIVSVRITTVSSEITGFTQGVNIKDSTSENDLYYYYKESSGNYHIVIYADVEKIYAPVRCYKLFVGLSNCKSIAFDNFDTSNVTDMRSMFMGCSSLTSLDLSNFDTSKVTDMSKMFIYSPVVDGVSIPLSQLQTIIFGDNFDTSKVTDMSSMFLGLQSLKTLDISNFSFASITSADNIEMMLGMGYDYIAQMSEGFDVDAFRRADDAGKIQMLIDAGLCTTEIQAQMSLSRFSNITTIIAPADLNGLEISLPGTYEYKDDSGNTISTDVLVEGKTHTLASASSDTSETGIISDSILLSLIALCFVFSGFMLLKKNKVR